MEFDKAQMDAVMRLRSGCILCGDVGSGKSRTALVYYFCKECGGQLWPSYSKMKEPKDLYIITTAKKRDSKEWEAEMAPFLLDLNGVKVTVDSWNNISKYSAVTNSFFIFDEQRLVGSGAWVTAFYRLTSSGRYRNRPDTGNRWILLSATPGDTWSDYIPIFVANKFYKTKSDFLERHAIYNHYSKYPKIDRYCEEKRLLRLKSYLLVNIDVERHTVHHQEYISVDYDIEALKKVMRDRWNIFDDEPIESGSQLCYVCRKVVNQNRNRIDKVVELIEKHPRVIIFYNFDYELDMLRAMCEEHGYLKAEWNGHKHEPLPKGDSWVYLSQYTAGAEGWNCITTDTIIFYSLNYSYKTTKQSSGRIDRRNTPYVDLYYYFIYTTSWIDKAIKRALVHKKNFNEKKYLEGTSYI